MKVFSAEERAPQVLKRLSRAYPDASCELKFRTPLQLLVASILAAQCTDARVNELTPDLFRKYRSAKDFADANLSDLEKAVRPTGFYKNKAKAIQNCCTQLAMEYSGRVPEGMDELTGLSGVGRKTANLVRAYAFGYPGIICDTHVLRVSKRLEFTARSDPEKVEDDLSKLLPEGDWTRFSTAVMKHGKACCHAKKPMCASCCIKRLCPSSLCP